MSQYTSAVLIVRRPDAELKYEIFGDEPLIIELDLGASFDILKPDLDEQDTAAEWIASVRDQLVAADLDDDDPLYLAVEGQLHAVMEAYQLEDLDIDLQFCDEDGASHDCGYGGGGNCGKADCLGIADAE